jgi:hypothetical protein
MRYKIHSYIIHNDGTYSNKVKLDEDLNNGWLIDSVETNSQRVSFAYPSVTFVTVVIRKQESSQTDEINS